VSAPGRLRRGRASSVAARTPLRVKLVAAVVALSALGLLVAGTAATTVLRQYLLNRVDSQLTGAFHDPRQLSALAAEGTPRRGPGPQPLGVVFVQFAGQARPLPGGMPPPDLPPRDRPNGAPFTVAAASGSTSWRVVEGYAVREDTGQTGVLAVAVPLNDVQSTVRRLQAIEAVVGLAVLALLAGAGFLLVRRSLRPLVAVETTAQAIAAGDLSLRVPESDPRTEVGRLSGAFNSMLGQIEVAFRAREASEGQARQSEERMRRFVGDASHELRTPLTSIRGFAELYRQGALPERADVDRAMQRVEDEAARMGLLVEDLLLLARLDQQRPLERQPVDLLELASDAVHDARAVDPDRPVRLVVEAATAPVVLGDAARLRQVFGNLVSNALTHTPANTPVVVRVSTTPTEAVVEVADSGPGLEPQDASRVFERFYRADASRARGQGGSGLGLSIVAALVAAHSGRAEVTGTPGGGATFRVHLPAAGAPDGG